MPDAPTAGRGEGREPTDPPDLPIRTDSRPVLKVIAPEPPRRGAPLDFGPFYSWFRKTGTLRERSGGTVPLFRAPCHGQIQNPEGHSPRSESSSRLGLAFESRAFSFHRTRFKAAHGSQTVFGPLSTAKPSPYLPGLGLVGAEWPDRHPETPKTDMQFRQSDTVELGLTQLASPSGRAPPTRARRFALVGGAHPTKTALLRINCVTSLAICSLRWA